MLELMLWCMSLGSVQLAVCTPIGRLRRNYLSVKERAGDGFFEGVGGSRGLNPEQCAPYSWRI